MNLNEIIQLLKLIDEAKLQEVELEHENFKVKVKRNLAPAVTTSSLTPQFAPPPPSPVYQAPVSTPEVQANATPPASSSPPSQDNLIPIKSPMTGTFYSSSSPDKPAFVTVGNGVKEGEPVCIIEAMKLFNEIESDVTGTVEKILVKDGQPVDLDQTLFLLRP